MAFEQRYREQVALLIRTLPAVTTEPCFALKGGTAINLFVRNLPRLSVDIDLTYLPLAEWSDATHAIDEALERIAQRLVDGRTGLRVVTNRSSGRAATKLVVRHSATQIKIEVTPVLRGCVFEPRMLRVSHAVEEDFGFAETRVVSFADLYAGKIVAALDRQHPRDFFDARDLLANEGINEDLRRAVLVYLLSHDRPLSEVLRARPREMKQAYEQSFVGMTRDPVSIEALTETRRQLVETVVTQMPTAHRDFLVSFEGGNPDWTAVGLEHARHLPAVRWRQRNLETLSSERRNTLVEELASVWSE